jgi:hypothetical protein
MGREESGGLYEVSILYIPFFFFFFFLSTKCRLSDYLTVCV